MAKGKITIYEKPTCSTCRAALGMLKGKNEDIEKINYYKKPFTSGKLKDLLNKMGIPARALLRTKEPVYKKLNLAGRNLSENELVRLMIKYPDLIQRPIAEKGNRAVLGRPLEKIMEFLKS